jgi:Sulfotransferase family
LRLVCVIGMHRSGTSVVARMLNLLGVSLGPEDGLLAPAPRNPAGFWENSCVVEVNDELLDVLGGNATTPPVLADGWERAAELDALRKRAAAVLASVSDGARIVALKDPRLSLTLPFWRTVTPVAHVVHCLRDPVEAAPSLSRWNPVDVEAAGEVWLRYVAGACRAGEQVLVTYEDVLSRPKEVARRLAAELDLPEPTADQLHAVDAFVDARLHRFRGEGMDWELCLPSLLYRLLVERGLRATIPVVELLQRAWLTDAELLRTRRAAGEIEQQALAARAALDELAAAEHALRTRLAVRTALRLARPAGPLLRCLRRRRRGGSA